MGGWRRHSPQCETPSGTGIAQVGQRWVLLKKWAVQSAQMRSAGQRRHRAHWLGTRCHSAVADAATEASRPDIPLKLVISMFSLQFDTLHV